jgi:hypothetical protein
MRQWLASLVVVAVTGLAPTPGHAVRIAFLDEAQSGQAQFPIYLTGIPGDLFEDLTGEFGTASRGNVLWIPVPDFDFTPPPALRADPATVATFVARGGILSYHDTYVSERDGRSSQNNALLPGAAGIQFIRDPRAGGLDIVNGRTLVTNGPGGELTDTSLDALVSVGFVPVDTIPAGGVPILSRSNPDEIVDFFYHFGGGIVYYSTIPLFDYLQFDTFPHYVDLYFEDPVSYEEQKQTHPVEVIYTTNELLFQAHLATVPDPPAVLLVSLGFLGMAALRGRRGRQSGPRDVHHTAGAVTGMPLLGPRGDLAPEGGQRWTPLGRAGESC